MAAAGSAGTDQGAGVAGLLATLAAAGADAGPDAVAKYMGAGFMGLGAGFLLGKIKIR